MSEIIIGLEYLFWNFDTLILEKMGNNIDEITKIFLKSTKNRWYSDEIYIDNFIDEYIYMDDCLGGSLTYF